MSNNMIDLTLLAQDTIDIKFDEDTIFRVPPEPTVGFTNKMLAYRQKVDKTKTDEAKFGLLTEITELILSQDTNFNKDDIKAVIDKLHVTQIEAVFNIYEQQASENMKNPN